MLILKSFSIVGVVLIAALWALSVYLEPSNLNSPAILHSATTLSLPTPALPTPAPQTREAIEPEVAEPKAAVASVHPSTHAVHHRSRER
jgi:hypothetical protein